MPTPLTTALAAGLSSGILFVVLAMLGLGVPFLLLPTFPLFMLGLRRGAEPLLYAASGATLIVLVLTGFAGALLYLGIAALPAVLLAPLLIARPFRPVGTVMLDATLYAALAALGMIVHFSGSGGIRAALTESINSEFALGNADPQVAMALSSLGQDWAFFFIGASAWWWVLLLYAHAAMANWVLKNAGQAIRPSLALATFDLPAWLLAALAGMGLLSILGDGELAFAASVLLIIFLLPYFLLGISLVHQRLQNWPSRTLALFVLYFFIFSQLWPALIIAGIGLWRQCKSVIYSAPKI